MKVLLADDHKLFSEGFSLLIKKILKNSVVTQVGSWSAALDAARTARFDLAMMDLFMPANNVWDQELKKLSGCQNIGAICILTSSTNQKNIHQAFELGVKGYIHKSSSLSEIQRAIELILDNKIYLPPKFQEGFPRQSKIAGAKTLTVRQHKILTMMAEGEGNRRIAIALDIKESTVKRHVYNIFQQLQANNRTEAVHLARQYGLLQNE